MIFRLRTILAAAAVALIATLAAFAPARAEAPTAREVMQLNSDLQDPDKAFDAVARARTYLANNPDSAFRVFLQRGIIIGLITGRAPGRFVVAAADTMLRAFRNQPLQQVVLNGEVAQYLVNHGDLLPRALQMARAAAYGVPPDSKYDPFRGFAFATLGEAYVLNDKPDSALTVLKRALASAPDTTRVLRVIGAAYERQKKDDLAIDAYARSLGVYLSSDTSALGPLRALWLKKGQPLEKMDQRIETARAASRQAIALDARRYERPAPGWTLPDLDGKSFKLADHAGKVVVLDFWGTWCGPCRQELPVFQMMYQKYKDKGVVFYGVNWERAAPGADPRQGVRDYMAKNSLDFPVVTDYDRVAQTAYEIEAFPTVFLIDKSGKIRYRNVGVAQGIEHILADQIESLME